MPEPYTHDFKYEVGGQFIRGEIEFNQDGITTLHVTEWSDPLEIKRLEDFVKWVEKCHELVESGVPVSRIIFKLK